MQLHERIKTVKDAESFASFLKAVSEDFVLNKPDWENPTIDRYFDALSAWLEAKTRESQCQLNWENITHLLFAGKHYE